ncbi:hypothetical protein FIBSPDRAFT_844333 [Athelia psychrophila]|uniref:DUF6534 domain-containing protein n=1 Tax=Athelia psychrophila TaxID=1759441 RepID=A0A167UP15_9AGAM|nr:hypothetical protein FIBSPDRAFT_844333 [Fibularhizoctonia sp. CBS 109695]
MASQLPAGISLTEPTPVLATGILQSFLQGVICMQTARYWDTGYDGDSLLLRCFVGVVVLLSVLQTVLEDYKMWVVLIHGQIWVKQGIFWTEPFLNGLIVSLCSGFLIRRCWKVLASHLLASMGLKSRYMAKLNKVGRVCFVLCVVEIADQRASAQEQLRPLVISWSIWSYGSFGASTNSSYAVTVYFWRSRTGLTSSNTVLFKLTAIAWETALLPAISMLTAISLFCSNRNEDVHYKLQGAINQIPYFFFVMTGKLYTVGFLRTLNVRTKLRERLQSQDLGRVSLGNWTWDQAAKDLDNSTRASIGSTVRSPKLCVH